MLLLGSPCVYSQGPPPPPPPPPGACASCVPIDQGKVAMIFVALLLGGYKLYKAKKVKSNLKPL